MCPIKLMNWIDWYVRVIVARVHVARSQLLVTWWRYQMETFYALLAICAGNSPITGEFPVQRPATQSFDFFSLICTGINGCVNNDKIGDLRRHCAHYDVIVMKLTENQSTPFPMLTLNAKVSTEDIVWYTIHVCVRTEFHLLTKD